MGYYKDTHVVGGGFSVRRESSEGPKLSYIKFEAKKDVDNPLETDFLLFNYSSEQSSIHKNTFKLNSDHSKDDRKSINSSRMRNCINMRIHKLKKNNNTSFNLRDKVDFKDNKLIKISKIAGIETRMPHNGSKFNYTSVSPAKVEPRLLYRNQIYDYFGNDKLTQEISHLDIIRHSEMSYSKVATRFDDNLISEVSIRQPTQDTENNRSNSDAKITPERSIKPIKIKGRSPKTFNPRDGVPNLAKQYACQDKMHRGETKKYIAMYKQAIRNADTHNQSQFEEPNIEKYSTKETNLRDSNQRNKIIVDNSYSLKLNECNKAAGYITLPDINKNLSNNASQEDIKGYQELTTERRNISSHHRSESKRIEDNDSKLVEESPNAYLNHRNSIPSKEKLQKSLSLNSISKHKKINCRNKNLFNINNISTSPNEVIYEENSRKSKREGIKTRESFQLSKVRKQKQTVFCPQTSVLKSSLDKKDISTIKASFVRKRLPSKTESGKGIYLIYLLAFGM